MFPIEYEVAVKASDATISPAAEMSPQNFRIGNNALERMIRRFAIGRKNWLFFGNAGDGKTTSILYTILCDARRHKLNEFEYLH